VARLEIIWARHQSKRCRRSRKKQRAVFFPLSPTVSQSANRKNCKSKELPITVMLVTIEKVGAEKHSPTTKVVKEHAYRKEYSNQDLAKQLITFYKLPLDSNLRGFLKLTDSKIPRGTFCRHYLKNCKLNAMRRKDLPVHQAEEIIRNYLSSLELSTCERTKVCIAANKYLRYQEELALVQLWLTLGSMAAIITKREALHMIDDRRVYACR
jgi:hypothetical protein